MSNEINLLGHEVAEILCMNMLGALIDKKGPSSIDPLFSTGGKVTAVLTLNGIEVPGFKEAIAEAWGTLVASIDKEVQRGVAEKLSMSESIDALNAIADEIKQFRWKIRTKFEQELGIQMDWDD